MEKRFTISGCSTCLGIAGAILLITAALLCGCTSTEPQQAQTTTSVPTGEVVNCTSGAQTGDMIEVDYIGTYDNGTEFDSSYKSGQSFSLILGSGGAIPGFDKALHCMEVNETKKFTLSPQEAYGEYDPARIVSMPIEFIPAGENTTIGDRVTLFDGGQLFQATLTDMNVTNVTFDLNSPLAGKTLTFEVMVRNVTPLEVYSGSGVTAVANGTEPSLALEYLDYKRLFRFNEDYIGKFVEYKGKIIQVFDNNAGTYSFRLAIEGKSDQMIYGYDYKGTRLLENDWVSFVGEVKGLEKYKTVLGDEKTIPSIRIESLSINAN